MAAKKKSGAWPYFDSTFIYRGHLKPSSTTILLPHRLPKPYFYILRVGWKCVHNIVKAEFSSHRIKSNYAPDGDQYSTGIINLMILVSLESWGFALSNGTKIINTHRVLTPIMVILIYIYL